MRISNARAVNFSSKVGKIVMALVCAMMIGDLFIAPAFCDDRGRGEEYQHRKFRKSRRVYRQPPRRYYSEPVYVPPPVVYAPAPYQSPGISIVFPFH